MKAFSKIFATAGLVLICFSCEKTPNFPVFREPQVDLDVDAIVKRGYINALVDNNSFSYFIYKGHPLGYEYELLQLLAKQLNVEPDLLITKANMAAERIRLVEFNQRKRPQKDNTAWTSANPHTQHAVHH